jgi:hypothetical protein
MGFAVISDHSLNAREANRSSRGKRAAFENGVPVGIALRGESRTIDFRFRHKPGSVAASCDVRSLGQSRKVARTRRIDFFLLWVRIPFLPPTRLAHRILRQ